MAEKGFKGISFPFRIGVKGGVVTSTTTAMDVAHIIEAMTQILGTRPMERGMEHHFKSEIDSILFEPNNVSIRTMLSYQVNQALNELEDRISVDSVDIVSEGSSVIAVISFTALKYNTSHTANIKVGDFNVPNSN